MLCSGCPVRGLIANYPQRTSILTLIVHSYHLGWTWDNSMWFIELFLFLNLVMELFQNHMRLEVILNCMVIKSFADHSNCSRHTWTVCESQFLALNLSMIISFTFLWAIWLIRWFILCITNILFIIRDSLTLNNRRWVKVAKNMYWKAIHYIFK